jgi:YbbR domain-containing protein
MDKLMDKPWFIKILSLALAVLLYSSIPHTGSNSNDINVPGELTSATITDIPVKIYYDTDNLVVSGIPKTVKMTIKGPVTHVQPAKTLKNFEVFVDLTEAKIGSQRVKLKVNNLSDKLKATIKPAYVNVNIQEKVTKEFKVDAEFNNSMVAEGYKAGSPIVEPNKVKITGAKNVIDRISYVKAILDDQSHLKESITKESTIRVLDKELNKLNVLVEPDTVKVTIPIKTASKTVPINVIKNGTPPAGITIDTIKLDQTEATIIGDEDAIKSTDNVRVEVDVSKINDDTTLTLPVIIGSGITKVTPQTVSATVVVKKTTEKTVTEIPINIKGLTDQYKAVIDDPANGMVNLLVSGPSTAVSSLNKKDFNVFIDLSNLTEGNHEVNVQVEGPPEVNWKPDKSTAKITINNA